MAPHAKEISEDGIRDRFRSGLDSKGAPTHLQDLSRHKKQNPSPCGFCPGASCCQYSTTKGVRHHRDENIGEDLIGCDRLHDIAGLRFGFERGHQGKRGAGCSGRSAASACTEAGRSTGSGRHLDRWSLREKRRKVGVDRGILAAPINGCCSRRISADADPATVLSHAR